MTLAGTLLVASVGAPLALLAACLSERARVRMPRWLPYAPLPALAAALLAPGAPLVVLQRGLVPLTLQLDTAGALLLGCAALLWIAAAAQAAQTSAADTPAPGYARDCFSVCWLLTLVGSLGVFIAADLASFFLAYALVSIPAYGLVTQTGDADGRRAGRVYMAVTILGETLLLIAFALLAHATPGGSLRIADAVAALPGAPARDVTLALLIAGFGMKIGLLPFHAWMPLAYRAAPAPAAAVLSGAAVKAGVIGLLRFLPWGSPLPGWGMALMALGFAGAFYGVLIGVTQRHPKTVLAYSSISQMGFIAALLGAGLAVGDTGAPLVVAFYAAHHLLVKGALFLAVGEAAVAGARRPWPVLAPAAVIGLGLAGLPLTGGALAKLAAKGLLAGGTASALAAASACGSALLMLHFCARLRAVAPAPATAPPARPWPWLGLAAASVLVPWVAWSVVLGGGLGEILDPATLWAGLWPVLVGLVAALALWTFGARLPAVPPGDVLAALAPLPALAARWGAGVARAEATLRTWPAATLSAVALVLGLALALAATR